MKKFILPVLSLFVALPAISAAYADNANELTDGSKCRDVSVIFAKGTNEKGNIGKEGLIGPTFFNALASLLPSGSMAVQGVAGEFSIATFLSGGDEGAVEVMTDLVLSTAERCPNTKIVMAGYSQGAQVLHETSNSDLFMVNPLLVNHVVAYLTFGDPDKDTRYTLVNNPSKVKIFCYSDDTICNGGLIPNAVHHTYQTIAPDAAAWVLTRIKAGFEG